MRLMISQRYANTLPRYKLICKADVTSTHTLTFPYHFWLPLTTPFYPDFGVRTYF